MKSLDKYQTEAKTTIRERGLLNNLLKAFIGQLLIVNEVLNF